MATYDITLTYPDGSASRVTDALKANYQVEGEPPLTNQEALDLFTAGVKRALKDIVLRHERNAARATADAGVVEVDVT